MSGVNAGIVHCAGRTRIEDLEVDVGVGSGNGLRMSAHDVFTIVAHTKEEPYLSG